MVAGKTLLHLALLPALALGSSVASRDSKSFDYDSLTRREVGSRNTLVRYSDIPTHYTHTQLTRSRTGAFGWKRTATPSPTGMMSLYTPTRGRRRLSVSSSRYLAGQTPRLRPSVTSLSVCDTTSQGPYRYTAHIKPRPYFPRREEGGTSFRGECLASQVLPFPLRFHPPDVGEPQL